MEYFPRIHHIGALPQSPRVTVKIERNMREIYWTDHLHVDVQRRNSEQDNGHSSGLDQRKSGILLTTQDHKDNGTESLN